MRTTHFFPILGLACAACFCWQRTAFSDTPPEPAAQPSAEAVSLPRAALDELLNTPIDPQTYRLGPGDELLISIIARSPDDFSVAVTPDGQIHLPHVGAVSVTGKTLDEAKRLIEQELRRVRKEFHVDLQLIRLRTISVQVVGEVKSPGRALLGPMTRVADALQHVGLTPISSRRHIEVRRKGVTLPKVDLERILKDGDETTNVMLETGDQVFVPRAKAIVTVGGEVNNPGDYEVDPGESVKQVIRRAGGVRATGSETAVYVERPGPDDRRLLVKADLTRNPPPVPVEDRDKITVPPLSTVQGSIRIVGAVKGSGENWLGDPVPKEGVQGINSGRYLLRKGDRVRDVILNVGGVTSKADLARAQIERLDDKGNVQVIPVNLQRLLVENDAAQNPELRDGDTLKIPTIIDQVYVLGQVLNPGPKQYEEGRTILDYIGESGGLAGRARKKNTTLVRGDLKSHTMIPVPLDRMYQGKVDPRTIPIKPGDILIVPEAQIKSWQDAASVLFTARTLLSGFFLF